MLNIADEYIEKFNQNTIGLAMVKYGMVYTTEDKSDGFVAPTRNMFQISMLKRTFRVSDIDGRIVGPLSLSSVLGTPLWHKGTETSDEALRDNVEQSLLELSLHPREEWDKYARDLEVSLKEVTGLDLKYPASARKAYYNDACDYVPDYL
jgi:hypothetical protein